MRRAGPVVSAAGRSGAGNDSPELGGGGPSSGLQHLRAALSPLTVGWSPVRWSLIRRGSPGSPWSGRNLRWRLLTATQFAYDGVSDHADVAFHVVRVLGSWTAPWRRATRAVLRRRDIARREGLPRRFRSSTLRTCGAGRPALELILERGLHGLGRTPEGVHAAVASATRSRVAPRANGDETLGASSEPSGGCNRRPVIQPPPRKCAYSPVVRV